jgi:hypothetical protein
MPLSTSYHAAWIENSVLLSEEDMFRSLALDTLERNERDMLDPEHFQMRLGKDAYSWLHGGPICRTSSRPKSALKKHKVTPASDANSKRRVRFPSTGSTRPDLARMIPLPQKKTHPNTTKQGGPAVCAALELSLSPPYGTPEDPHRGTSLGLTFKACDADYEWNAGALCQARAQEKREAGWERSSEQIEKLILRAKQQSRHAMAHAGRMAAPHPLGDMRAVRAHSGS